MRRENSTAVRRSAAPRPPTLRSRVTNGKSLFVKGGDGRGPWARRLRDVVEAHLSDLGGLDNVSEAERSIVRRAAVLTVELERLEAKFAIGKGSDNDLDLYQRTAGNLRRLLESIGLDRRPREVQTLEQYVGANYGEGTEESTGERQEIDSASSLAPAVETPMPGPPSLTEGPPSTGGPS